MISSGGKIMTEHETTLVKCINVIIKLYYCNLVFFFFNKTNLMGL